MTQEPFINILIAEDNDVSREMMSGALRGQGYRIFGAIDGESAIKVIEERQIDLALVDINMSPKSGFELIKHMMVKGYNIPSVIITGDDSSHILVEASALGVAQVVQKPVEPEKLIQIVQRNLRRRGMNPKPLAVTARETRYSPQELMQKAIALADRNAKSKRGGPFGAIVSDPEGRVLGEGANGITSRADPTAHAEVMAIRKAAERLGRTDLSDCTLYCSSQPTAIGQALIASVGMNTVYYGLAADEVRTIRKEEVSKPHYKQLAHDEALAMFKSWQEQKEKVAD